MEKIPVDLPQHLDIHSVCRLTGLSRATIYRMIKADLFPPPASLGVRRSLWVRKTIDAWIAKKAEENLHRSALYTQAGTPLKEQTTANGYHKSTPTMPSSSD